MHTAKEEIEALRRNWIENFALTGGVQLLASILQRMYEQAKLQPKESVFKAKIEKDCWNQVLKIIRVILMSTFVAKLPSPELSAALSRRMSQNAGEEEPKP